MGILDLLDRLEAELAAARSCLPADNRDCERALLNARGITAELRRRMDRDDTGKWEALTPIPKIPPDG